MRAPLRQIRSRLLVASLLFASCTTWQRAGEFRGWSLYVQDGAPISVTEYRQVVDRAFETVAALIGTFTDHIRVHAWNGGVEMSSGNRGRIRHGTDGDLQEIPGIGPARVRAFHARSSGGPFEPSGVFVGAADTGTVAHELVHARLAQEDRTVPLWFEEGLATLLGDGAVYKGRWVVDGLACWPWRELGEETLTDEELADLLEITPDRDHSLRENVLVHFIGWAVVFDLYRELGVLDWDVLMARFLEADDPVAEARRRIENTTRSETPVEWIEQRFASEDPGERMAAAKGSWKLYSNAAVSRLLRRLRRENDPDVRVALAVNALASASETQLSWRQRGRLWRSILPVFEEADLPDEGERTALRSLYRSYRYGTKNYDTQAALGRLARFWEE
ncbi:MAG: hypothetical protein QGI46_02155 [Planctomycetota bacterium]|jgi:hypothetical protein|nr:hypothetical protein [Planctomycetota bacterium]